MDDVAADTIVIIAKRLPPEKRNLQATDRLDDLGIDSFTAVERRDRLLDTGNLPFVNVEIFIDCLGCEERTTPTCALRQSLQPPFGGRIDPHRESG